MNLIVDTNVIISALIKDSTSRNLIIYSKFRLFLVEQSLIEIKKHKKLICSKSNLEEEKLEELLTIITRNFKLIKNEELANYWQLAHDIINEIDKGDIAFLAAALKIKDSAIWSNDLKLKNQNIIKIYNTKEIIEVTYFL